MQASALGKARRETFCFLMGSMKNYTAIVGITHPGAQMYAKTISHSTVLWAAASDQCI